MNPERILIAAEAVGIGRAALRKAAAYARLRVVFRRPIGQNQSIAHPLAESWMALEAANLMALKAASLYDRKLDCAAEANAAKYLAGEARSWRAVCPGMLSQGIHVNATRGGRHPRLRRWPHDPHSLRKSSRAAEVILGPTGWVSGGARAASVTHRYGYSCGGCARTVC